MSSRRKQSNPRSLKDVDDNSGKHGHQDAQEVSADSPLKAETCSGDVEAAAVVSADVTQGLSNSLKKMAASEAGSDGEKDAISERSDSESREYPYGCSYCDKAFSKFSYVRDHELVHSDEMPYQCEYCQRPFRHKRSRDRHMKLHTGDKSYRCSLCDSAFSRSDHLKNHMKSHSNTKWLPAVQAAKLSEQCTTPQAMDNGLADKVTGQVPKCQLCKETFVNYYELDEHVKKHDTSTGYQNKTLEYHCTHCAKQSLKQVFVSLLALEQHVTHMHTGKGLSLLSCPHCDAAFPTVPTLNGHIEQEHPQSMSRGSPADTAAATGSKSSSLSQSSMPDTAPQSSNNAAVSDGESLSHGSALTDALACNVCRKVFSSSTDLISHVFTDHGKHTLHRRSSKPDSERGDTSTPLDLSSRSPSASPIVCHICSESVGSLSLLVEHNQAKHWEMPKAKCNVCSEVISSSHQHLEHMEQHYLSTRRHYLCRCCKQSFSLVDELQSHLIAEHSRKIYNCLLCTEMFPTEVDLKIHLTVEHSNESKTYKCACCGLDFEKIVTWRAHMLQAHIDLVLPSAGLGLSSTQKGQTTQCPYCVKTFRTEAEVNLHVLSHQKSFQCSLCDERFAVEYLRDKHMQSEHSRQQRSDSNRKSPSTSQGSGSDGNPPFVCAICDRVFHSEDVYEEHKRKSHSSVKPWQSRPTEKSSVSSSATSASLHMKMFSTACDTCGKAFKTYSELDKHSRVHFGPISLTCIICDQVFSSLADMAKHKLQHCKVPSTKPCIICRTDIKDVDTYMKHSHVHIEPDSTIICCVCKHRVTSQVELELHAEFHFPKNPSLSCASCKKACPYFIQLPAQLTENPQFLLCQECLIMRKQATSLVIPGRVMPLPPHTPEGRSPPMHLSITPGHLSAGSTSPHSLPNDPRDHKANLTALHVNSPPGGLHRCPECNVKYETREELKSHDCMHKTCVSCQKVYKISELVCKLDSYICATCDAVPKDLWKCDKCKLTFTREEKYQRHNCIALGDGKMCYLCQGRFNHSQLLLRGNKLVCKGCDRKLMTCRICAEVYSQSEGHRCSLKCEGCHDMFFTTQQELGKPILCKLCVDKQTQATLDARARPITNLSKDKVYQCIKCQKTCESENDIKIHILTSHVNEKNHKCHLCGSMFVTPAKLQSHLVEHNFTFNEHMACPKCSWSTSDATALIAHCASEHSVTNRSYICNLCLQSFFFETELINHSLSHHSEVVDLYKSGGNFMKRLKSKKRSHDNDSNSPPKIKAIKSETFSDNDDGGELFCSKCDLEFVSPEQYNIHMNLHHRETKVSCSWCARFYSCQEDLRDHMTQCPRAKDRRESDEVFTSSIPNGKASAFSRVNSDASSTSTLSYNSRLPSQCNSPQSGVRSGKTSNSDIEESSDSVHKREPLIY
ncbi:zinc finger protein 423-like [Watersipora subatra]|uniref:zinc finger protein 423-like n=1 Tax=Watersipora subatra TaxID=2589382 RepID=UPI00355C5475